MIFGTRPRRASTGKFRPAYLRSPAPLVPLPAAFVTRRNLFGPHDLRDDRIKAESYLADDLSPAARRALREGVDA